MSTSVDPVREDAPGTAPELHYRATGDVPGLLLDRAADVYASEELRRRVARTERMIRKAQSLK